MLADMRVILILFLLIPFPVLAGDEAIAQRIIDADTIEIGGTVHRLWGIDAPERGQTCDRDGQQYDCGAYSKLALTAFIGGDPVRCDARNQDRYGRSVSQCYVGNTDLGSWLVANGFAVEYPRYSRGYYASEQDLAETGQRGIWAGDFTLPWVWRRERNQ